MFIPYDPIFYGIVWGLIFYLWHVWGLIFCNRRVGLAAITFIANSLRGRRSMMLSICLRQGVR